ncbi:MAG: leucine-rich repeat domain-containing protein [Porticoccaceae bacterium]
MKLLVISLVFMSLLACDRYQIKLNEQQIYTPRQLFSDYKIPDMALSNCIKQVILDQSVWRAEELTSINCAYAGITDLTGLSRFTRLEVINLANNNLTDIKALMFFGQLRRVDLSGNNSLTCDDIKTLSELLPQQLVAPNTCL